MFNQLRKPKSKESGVEELFLAHYDRVFDWALHLTDHDRERAEDLVHDVFIQLSLNPPKLERIENFENYLFVCLRNLHRFQWRRERRGVNGNALSITDFDSIETGLQTVVNFDNRLQIWQELQLACRYAVERRETSRAGSVFILRFFHGYYPSEIARILCGSRPAVTELLRVARAEVLGVLRNPAKISFLKNNHAPLSDITPDEHAPDAIIKNLREEIFAARAGECLSDERLSNLFEANHAALVDRERLAHFVVCENCLSRINRLFGWADLSDRFPPDTFGPGAANQSAETPKNVKPFPRQKTDQKRQSLEKFRRKLQAIYEHEPRELWVAVNDSILGTQPVVGATSEQTLGLETIEDARFVHVFSEQNVRLCALSVESPPAGDFEQATRISLSDNRTLTVNLSFCGNWRHVQVIYFDSSLETMGAAQSILPEKSPKKFGVTPSSGIANQPEIPPEGVTPNDYSENALKNQTDEIGDAPRPKFWRLFDWFAPFFKREFWLRPTTITILLAAPLIALLVFWRLSMPEQPKGRQLIERAMIAEKDYAPTDGKIVRRIIEVEERRADNQILNRHQIEIWQRTAAPNPNEYTTTRRVFDETGTLAAGEWSTADGKRVRKNLAFKPAKNSVKQKPFADISEAVWLEFSIKNLNDFVGGDSDRIKIVESENSFVLEAAAPNAESAVKRISLTVSKTDSRPTAQSVWTERSGDLREFRFLETRFEKFSPVELPADVFNPDALFPDLPAAQIKPLDQIIAPPNAETPVAANADSAAPFAEKNAVNRIATAEMEVEALNLLSGAKGDLNEQISVVRVPNGVLRITGIVETPARKAELLRVFAPFASNPAAEIKIQTVAEVVAEQQKKRNAKSSKSNEITVEQKDADGDRLAAEDDLRSHFTARGVAAENLDGEIRRYAQEMFARSRRVAQNAGALRQITSRFSAAELENLTPKSRADWLALVRRHARNLQTETATLRSTLAPVFGGNSGANGAGETINTNDAAAVQSAAARLAALANETDRQIRAAFSASSGSGAAAVLKSKNFQSNLQRIEQTAAALQE